MNVQGLWVITEKYNPWLLQLIASRTGEFKLQKETEDTFSVRVSKRISSVVEEPWENLTIKEGPRLSHVGIEKPAEKRTFISRYYTVIWQKSKGGKILFTGNRESSGLSVHQLLKQILNECIIYDTVQVVAVIETVHTLDLDMTNPRGPNNSFVIYPCNEKQFTGWVDQNRTEIDQELSKRHLTLFGCTLKGRRK